MQLPSQKSCLSLRHSAQHCACLQKFLCTQTHIGRLVKPSLKAGWIRRSVVTTRLDEERNHCKSLPAWAKAESKNQTALLPNDHLEGVKRMGAELILTTWACMKDYNGHLTRDQYTTVSNVQIQEETKGSYASVICQWLHRKPGKIIITDNTLTFVPIPLKYNKGPHPLGIVLVIVSMPPLG